MSVDGSSSLPEVQSALDDSTANTQDVKTNDSTTASVDHDTSSPPPEVHSTTTPETSIADQNPNSDPNELAPTITTRDLGNYSSPVIEPEPVEAPKASTTDSDDSKHDIANSSPPPEISPTSPESTETNPPAATSDTGITETPKISSPEIQEAPKASTDPPPQVPSADPTIDTTSDQNQNANDTPASDSKQNKEAPTSDPTPEQERKHLLNLIDQDLNFVEKIGPKLGKHQERIKKEADEAKGKFEILTKPGESCELKELKDMKKIVTKLKLQIPAKYRTYGDDDEKNKQSDMENKGKYTTRLIKQIPRLHNKLFHESTFCKTIQERYDKLTDELKLCLLCFSVFPENVIISRRLMVYWWIGEGLIRLEDQSGKEEDHANAVFQKLMDRDFIEPVSKRHGRNVATCKMHPMIRASLVMIADKVNFFDFDEYGAPKDFGKFDEIESPEDVPEIYPLGDPREFFDFFNEQQQPIPTDQPILFVDPNGNPIPFAAKSLDTSQPPVNRIGKPIDTTKKFYFYERKKIRTKSYKVCLMGSGLSKGITWEKLHMLFNVKDDILEFKPEWFLRMKNVNVVFLGRWQSSAAHHIEVEEFKFEESLEHMKNVRFFSLQGVSRISELPKSISSLESLMILDLRACHNLEVIPKSIGSLKFLTHLDMSECYLLEHMPKEISTLEALQVLKGFVVVESPSRHACTLNDLRKLENLRKLSMYTHMKEFPLPQHLDALQKFEVLRKLTILWGGHESLKKSGKSKKDVVDKVIDIAANVKKYIPKRKWVNGKLVRMNAFNNSTLGSRLEKLDLKCYPESFTPTWLTPGSLQGLKKLYIRGGRFSDLGQYQDILEWNDSIPPIDTWNVEVLRLKYLDEVKMDWRELQELFPKLTSLEKVKCPQLTLFPCNESGIWTKKPPMTTRY